VSMCKQNWALPGEGRDLEPKLTTADMKKSRGEKKTALATQAKPSKGI